MFHTKSRETRSSESGCWTRSSPVRKHRNALCFGPAAVKQSVGPAREADIHVPFLFALQFRVANEAAGRCLFSHGTHPNDIKRTKVITQGMDEKGLNGPRLNVKQNDSSSVSIRPPHDMGCPETNSHNISFVLLCRDRYLKSFPP